MNIKRIKNFVSMLFAVATLFCSTSAHSGHDQKRLINLQHMLEKAHTMYSLKEIETLIASLKRTIPVKTAKQFRENINANTSGELMAAKDSLYMSMQIVVLENAAAKIKGETPIFCSNNPNWVDFYNSIGSQAMSGRSDSDDLPSLTMLGAIILFKYSC